MGCWKSCSSICFVLALVLLAGAPPACGEQAPMKPAGRPPMKFEVQAKVLTTIQRVPNITLSEDGNYAWACAELGSKGIYRLDAKTGKILQHYGRRSDRPQNILEHDGILYLVANSMVWVQKTAPDGKFEMIPLHDRRLRGTSSASMTPDGRWLWLTSAPMTSAVFGKHPPALFRVDIQRRFCLQVDGLPPDKMSWDATDAKRWPQWFVCADKQGRVFFADADGIVRISPPDSTKVAAKIDLGFVPIAAPARVTRCLPIVGKNKGAVIDTESREIVSRFDIKGTPTAVCANSDDTAVFVAVADSNHVTQFDVKSGRAIGQLDLSRPGGTAYRDATHGKNVHDIVALRWAGDPDRLVALGYDGYIFIVATLRRSR